MISRVAAALVILSLAACTVHSQQESAKAETEREPLKLFVGQSLADATEVIKRSGRKYGEGGSFRMVPDQWNLWVEADPNHANVYVFYSKSMLQVTRLSMAFFPSKQSGKAYYSWVTATEVLLRDDGSYSVHFVAPVADDELKKLETKHPKSEIPASRVIESRR